MLTLAQYSELVRISNSELSKEEIVRFNSGIQILIEGEENPAAQAELGRLKFKANQSYYQHNQGAAL